MHSERIIVSIEVGSSKSTVESVISTEKSWQDLTEAQIKEKVQQLYRETLKSVLTSRKKVTQP